VKMKACLALLVLAAMAASASAAKLVVIATNSGTGSPPVDGAFPPVAAGAKGFLIGIDNNTPEDVASPLAFQDLTFASPGLIQRLAPNAAAAEAIPSPNVQLRNEALAANGLDPVPGSTFGANDSWWWNQAQTVNGQTLTLGPISTGIQGGLPGGPMIMTGTYNASGNVEHGVWRLAYVEITQDALITGILAAGPNGGQFSYDLALGTPDPLKMSHSAILRFSDGTIQPVPEPSTIVLAALGLVGLGVGAWRRRK